jgi:hypothetical protein
VFYVDATSSTTIEASLKTIATIKKVRDKAKDALLWMSGQTGNTQNWMILFNNADDTNLDLQEYFPPSSHGNIIITTRNFDSHIHGQGPNSHAALENMLAADAENLLLKSARCHESVDFLLFPTTPIPYPQITTIFLIR